MDGNNGLTLHNGGVRAGGCRLEIGSCDVEDARRMQTEYSMDETWTGVNLTRTPVRIIMVTKSFRLPCVEFRIIFTFASPVHKTSAGPGL